MAKVCCVCSKIQCSYKCPVCKEHYCSTDCYKKHKASNCQQSEFQKKEITEDARSNIKYEFPTDDTVPVEKLNQLHNSEELRNCLKNPHLRNIMRAILSDKDPTRAIALAMTEPIFVEMADACLKIVEPQVSDESY